jgi:hypothetical protein
LVGVTLLNPIQKGPP